MSFAASPGSGGGESQCPVVLWNWKYARAVPSLDVASLVSASSIQVPVSGGSSIRMCSGRTTYFWMLVAAINVPTNPQPTSRCTQDSCGCEPPEKIRRR